MGKDYMNMSAEDLNKLYTNSTVDENTEETTSDETTEETTSDETTEETTSEETTEETTSEETTEETDYKKMFDDLKKEVEGQKSLMGKWSNEVGSLREQNKMLSEMLAKNQTQEETETENENDPEFLAKFAENPNKALKEQLKKMMEQKQKSDNTAQLRRQQIINQNKELLNKEIENFDDYVEDIAELVNADTKGNAEAVTAFKNNLYTNDPILLFNMAKRAQAEKKIKDLEKLVENLKKGKPQATTVTKKSSAPSSSKKTDTKDIDFVKLMKMPMKDLQEMYDSLD